MPTSNYGTAGPVLVNVLQEEQLQFFAVEMVCFNTLYHKKEVKEGVL
jgi:hypothetical protein